MKVKFIFLFFTEFLITLAYCQEKLYYNTFWEITVPDSAIYYATIDEDTIISGKLIYYYVNGNVFESKRFQNGRKVGKYIQFYPNQKKAMIGVYHDNVLKRIAAWDKEGQRILKRGNGKDVSYYPNGFIKEIINVKKGLPSGTKLIYHDNGQCAEEGLNLLNGYYRIKSSWGRDGKPMVVDGTGKYEMVYPNGKVKSKGEYLAGFEVGEWQKFYSNGKKKSIENYTNGMLDGKVKYYYQNGLPEAIGNYVMGKRTGVWHWYNKNGQETKIETY